MATLVSVVFAQGTWAQTDLPETAGATLTAGKTYKVSKNVNINLDQDAVDSYGKPTSGLIVPENGRVIIEICKGYTLTVKGTHAAGQYGAGAGISVPSSSTLIITGEGTLIAQGGDAGNGGAGEAGQIGGQGKTYDNTNKLAEGIYEISSGSLSNTSSGAGGNGGYGGGGAGAGIGGAGGAGGAGGTGCTDAPRIKRIDFTPRYDAKSGDNGSPGIAGSSMGKVSILENVTVIATSGKSGTAGKGGISGVSLIDQVVLNSASAISGGGGGGAGGGAGMSTNGIGAGGCGAGGGGGGGCGAIDYTTFWNSDSSSDLYSCRGGSGKGGLSAEKKDNGGVDTTYGQDTGGDGINVPKAGGAGGAGGAAGVLPEGANGSLYVASTAKLDATTTTIGATKGATYSIVTNEGASLLYGVKTINESLTAVNSDANVTSATITLSDNSNVGSETLNNPGKPVTLDLNGKGLLVGGVAGNITGNANVTILLKDGNNRAAEYGTDNVPYANESPINGSPIKYTRKISSVQSGNWQSLYLPFEAKRPADTNIGVVNKVEIDETSARLWIDKLDDDANLAAYTPYFIQHAEGEFEIEAATTTLVAYKKNAPAAIEGGDYTIAGSLKSTDRVSEAEKNFWSMTNGGGFSWVKVGVGQRPYRWVIYGDPQDATNAAGKIMTLFVLGVDDTTTGVQDIKIADSNDVYSISGMKLSNNAKLSKGLYISNGKKFYVK